MSQMTVTQRALLSTQAKRDFRDVEACAAASCEDLGRGRDLLNRVHTGPNPTQAAEQLTALVEEVWHHNPPHHH